MDILIPGMIISGLLYALKRNIMPPKIPKNIKTTNGYRFTEDCKELIIDDYDKTKNYFYNLGVFSKKLEEVPKIINMCNPLENLKITSKNYENYVFILNNLFNGIFSRNDIDTEEEKFITLLSLTAIYITLINIYFEKTTNYFKFINPIDITFNKFNKGFKISNSELIVTNDIMFKAFFKNAGKYCIYLEEKWNEVGFESKATVLYGICNVLIFAYEDITIFYEDEYFAYLAFSSGLLESKLLTKEEIDIILSEYLNDYLLDGLDVSFLPKTLDDYLKL